jgi:hypothetical protein
MRVEKYFSLSNLNQTRVLELLCSLASGWLGGAVVAAAGLKAWLLVAGAVPFNADEAVVALMARHILQGARPVFFYGQAYMGSLDAFLVALGFAVFGEQVWVVRFVQILLYVGTLVTTAALGKAALGSRGVGTVAAWLLVIPAVNVTLYTTATLGGYGEMLLVGNLVLLAALRIATQLSHLQSPKPRSWLAFGFLCGLGMWAFGLTLVYTLPAALYLGWTAWKAGPVAGPGRQRVPAPLRGRWTRRERAKVWSGWAAWVVSGGLAGSAPWWGYALAHGPGRLLAELGGAAVASVDKSPYLVQAARHVFNLAVLGLPAALGLRPPWEVRWLALPLMPFALAFWLGVTGFTLRRLARPIRKPAAGRRLAHPQPASFRVARSGSLAEALAWREKGKKDPIHLVEPRWLLAGVAITLFAGFVLTPFGVDPSGRYFLPLSVLLALAGGETIQYLRRHWGGWAYGLVGLVLAFNAWGTLECALRTPPGLTTQFDAQTRIDHRFDPSLIRFLLDHGEYTGYSNYWVAYPLAFQSKEALIFVPDLPYHLDFRHTARDNRYEPYARLVEAAERAAYITANHPALESRLREGFSSLGVGWQEQQIGDYRVFYGLSRHVRPGELDLSPLP